METMGLVVVGSKNRSGSDLPVSRESEQRPDHSFQKHQFKHRVRARYPSWSLDLIFLLRPTTEEGNRLEIGKAV